MRTASKNFKPQIASLIEFALTMLLLNAVACVVLAQTPVPTPTPDKRGLGVESSSAANSPQAGSQTREAKPELVLQTGYNNFFGATTSVA